jgi:hypothetical protein
MKAEDCEVESFEELNKILYAHFHPFSRPTFTSVYMYFWGKSGQDLRYVLPLFSAQVLLSET